MRNRNRRGFTIVELLVVITIIGILMALVLPAVNIVRANAQKIACINNQDQIATAITTYDVSKGYLPASRGITVATRTVPSRTLNWIQYTLTELGRGDVYEQVVNGALTGNIQIDLLVCPSDPPARANGSPLSYVVNGGMENSQRPSATQPTDYQANGVFDDRTIGKINKTRLSYVAKHDGTSTTIMLTENRDASEWTDLASEFQLTTLWTSQTPTVGLNTGILTDTRGMDAAHARPSSKHTDGFVVTFCDGHTRFLSDQIQYGIYALLMTSHGSQAKNPQNGSAIPQTALISEADLNP